MADETAPAPEMPTTPTWRGWMKERREALGLTQGELGRKVGITQPIVSNLETGAMAASSAVTAISAVLGIPPPFVPVEHDDERRLLEAGRALRHRNRDVFLAQLQVLEMLAGNVTPKG